MNSIGRNYQITLIGSSHGNLVGVVIDGVPVARKINTDLINKALSRRKPGQSKITTDRKEDDRLIIETGILNGVTTGGPIVAYVRNADIDSSYYDEIVDTPRPGHADYPAKIKYNNAHDHRGGGRFSGRMTIGLVIAGEIARQILSENNINVVAYTKSIGAIEANVVNTAREFIYGNIIRTADPASIDEQVGLIMSLKREGDSCGGIVECIIDGLPVAVGEPFFDSIESRIAHMIFSIPAVKGIEFGSGFNASKMLGSEHNDPLTLEEGRIRTIGNNAGGILGGLSNGMQVIFRTAFKPTSSIKLLQKTVDIERNKEVDLKVRGRHDPCIVPRAVPVVDASTCCVLLDLMIEGGFLR